MTTTINSSTISAALLALRPGAAWALDGDSLAGLQWLDITQPRPTDAEIEAAIPAALAALDAAARRRAIDAELDEIDRKSIRALRAGDTARLAELEARAADLRKQRP